MIDEHRPLAVLLPLPDREKLAVCARGFWIGLATIDRGAGRKAHVTRGGQYRKLRSPVEHDGWIGPAAYPGLSSASSGRSCQDCAAKNSRNAARMPFLTEYAANLPSSFARSTAVNSAASADVIIAVQSVAANKGYLHVNGSSGFDRLYWMTTVHDLQ